jgi:streptogramin lyase
LLAGARRLERQSAALNLREALRLWRGAALADFTYDDFAKREAERLEELRQSCIERRIDLELALGHHDDLVPELEALVKEHPLRERLRHHLMLALYRSGRQAEALEAYRDARSTLREELGLEPSNELQSLQRAILAHDESVAAPARVELPEGRAPVARRPSRGRLPVVAAVAGAVLLAVAAAIVVLELTGDKAGSVIVPPNSLARISPHGMRVVSYVGVGRDPAAVAVGPNAVWVANAGDGTVTRVDPGTGQVVRTIGIGAEVSDVAVGFGSVWVAGGNDGTVTRIDLALNQVERTITPAPASIVAPSAIFFVAVDDKHVWVTQGNALLRIDPATNQVDRRVTVGSPLGLAAGGGYVWVTNGAERLLRIDAATAELTTSQLLPTGAFSPVFTRASLWLIAAAFPHGQIEQLDPVSLAPGATVTAAANARALAAGGGFLWAIDNSGNLDRIDQDGTVRKLHVGPGLSAVAATPETTWVAVTRAT